MARWHCGLGARAPSKGTLGEPGGPINQASGSATQRPLENMSGHLPHVLINMHGLRVWGEADQHLHNGGAG
ncbi:unnamed protein product [Lota lota]